MNEEKAREKIKVLTGQAEEQEQSQKNLFEEIAKEIENVNPSLGGFEELGAILAMPEDQFAILAPIFIDELQRSFNNISDKLVLVQTLNASGVKVEDLQESYMEIIEQIDGQLGEALSRPKRDFLKKMLGITYNAIADTEGIAKKVIQIPIELCHPDAKIPEYANLGDAGLDIYATEDITVHPGETKLVKTGIKVAIPYGYELQVRPKSGRALKTKFRVANAPGTIDSGYRQEVGVIIDNIEPPIKDIEFEYDRKGRPVIKSILKGSDFTIGKGEKFAQLVLNEVPKVSFYQVESVDGIGEDRGGGFGSSSIYSKEDSRYKTDVKP